MVKIKNKINIENCLYGGRVGKEIALDIESFGIKSQRSTKSIQKSF